MDRLLAHPREVRDGDFMMAVDAPNIGQQTFPGFGWDTPPYLGRWQGEGGQGFDGHESVSYLGLEAGSSFSVNWYLSLIL